MKCEKQYCQVRLCTKSENPSHGQCEDGSDPFYKRLLVFDITARSAPEAELQFGSNTCLAYLSKLIEAELTPLLRGWLNYFRLAEVKGIFEVMNFTRNNLTRRLDRKRSETPTLILSLCRAGSSHEGGALLRADTITSVLKSTIGSCRLGRVPEHFATDWA
jgi:hypothetical protein